MALDTYDNLKSSIKSSLDVGNELDSDIDDFILVCEEEMRRELRLREMIGFAALTLAADSRSLTLPTNFLDAKLVRLRSTNASSGPRYLHKLEQITEDKMVEFSRNDSQPPCWFNFFGTTFEFDSPADQEYTVELIYYADFDGLSDTVSTNVVLQNAPDLYLYGSLAASAPFLMHDERVPLWQSLYNSKRDRANKAARKSIRTGPQVTRVAGRIP